ncbi:hypothetical protein [Phenylobacterium sp.]|uniref:hypothetical protein n=1 Tax=Phenylobacterium sp. TaxID=1871053 RepID=UPI002DEC3A82|nr:hypothetical protein [Phenylobacterium sp.]
MISRRAALAALFALAGLAPPAQAAETIGYSPAAQKVLARARQAAGGAAWNRLRGWHESGRQGGLAYEAWFDPLRYGMRVETHEPAGLDVRGFNGPGDWRITPAGEVTGIDVTRVASEARTRAFFDGHGYFYPGRFDARGDFLGVKSWQGRSFEVVNVKPWGGTARELWFDRRSHLLTRMVDRTAARPVALQLSDYRKVGEVRVAFRITPEPDGGPAAFALAREVESLDFRPADRAMFSLPRRTEP